MTTQDVLPPDTDAPAPGPARRPSRTFAVVTGLVAAGVALGVAELLAGLDRTWRSPVLDVGDRLIDAAPPFVKEFAIETFGTNDKPALLVGIGVFLALYAAVVGIVALRHRLVLGVVGIALFGVIGVWASSSRRAAAPGTSWSTTTDHGRRAMSARAASTQPSGSSQSPGTEFHSTHVHPSSSRRRAPCRLISRSSIAPPAP
jgi:hypothetical protein